MNKKEISEIRRRYNDLSDCGVLRLAGCYVNGEKEKVETFTESFLTLPEEEAYKYLDLFRKTLSGTPGRNLFDMDFPLQEVPGDGQRLLMALRESELRDDGLLELFYDEVIKSFDYTGNYLILLIAENYDVPMVRLDGIRDEEGAESVYRYILCSICPMNLTKPGLGFDDLSGGIHTLKQNFAVEAPDTGFLYPAFNERSTDMNALLYYTKKTDIFQEQLLGSFLGVSAFLPAKQQKEGFNGLVSEVLGEESDIDTVISLQENLHDRFEEKKAEASGDPVFLEKEELRELFSRSGVPEEKMKSFDSRYDERFDLKKLKKASECEEEVPEFPSEEAAAPAVIENRLLAENIAPVRSFEVKSPEMTLRISSKRLDLLETRVIDGRRCLVIELTDDLTVNGVPVSHRNPVMKRDNDDGEDF